MEMKVIEEFITIEESSRYNYEKSRKKRESMSKKKPLAKSIKAAFPLFALFGGQGFASNRVNSVSLSSRKFAKKPVVFVDNSESKVENFDSVNQAKVKNPFAAFTSSSNKKIKSATVHSNNQTLEFLSSNGLLAGNSKTSSKISGNINSIKSFSDPWNFSTKLNNPTTISFSSSCVNPSYRRFNAFQSNTLSASCRLLDASNNTAFFNAGAPSAIESYCQNLHMLCDQQPLPVELEKFEIE